MSERRSKPRSRVLKAGTIEFNRAGAISCTVRNLSDDGACLEVESLIGIPNSFNLTIGNREAVYPCRIVWRSLQRMGVTFIRPEQ